MDVEGQLAQVPTTVGSGRTELRVRDLANCPFDCLEDALEGRDISLVGRGDTLWKRQAEEPA